MDFTAKKINFFLFFKLPSAFWCGVRVQSIDGKQCSVSVRHSWKNQNPFHSMYFAVQAMAAELSTGALVMYHIEKSSKKISMLVLNNNSTFTKKATGRITFTSNDGHLIEEGIKKTITTREAQKVWMQANGTNEKGEIVSEMHFEWTLKLKKEPSNNS